MTRTEGSSSDREEDTPAQGRQRLTDGAGTDVAEPETVAVGPGRDVPTEPGIATSLSRALLEPLRAGSQRRVSGLLAAILVTMIVFGTVSPFFFTTANMLGLIRAMATFAIVALGETLVLVSGELDLSVGAIYGLAAMVGGVLWVSFGWPVGLALLTGLLVGVLVGLVNAAITTIIRVPSFITTLGMLSLAQGVTFLISGSQSISGSRSQQGAEYAVFKAIGGSRLWFDIPIHIIWLIAVAAIIGYLLHRTLFGFRLAAIGGNPEAARVSGLPSRRYKFWVFAIAGGLAGLAGILDFSFIGSTAPGSGQALTFPVFAAVIIGGASLSGGRGTVVGTLAGAFLLTLLNNGLSLLGVGAFAQLIFVGAVTIGAVALDQWATRRKGQAQVLHL